MQQAESKAEWFAAIPRLPRLPVRSTTVTALQFQMKSEVLHESKTPCFAEATASN